MRTKMRASMKTAAYATQKLPKNAKRVFKGVIFSIYQWRQKVFDGSYRTFELATKPNVANIIAVADGKILMLREMQPGIKLPFWGLPGGRIGTGESPLHGAKRELLEETGYTSKDWVLFGTEGPRWKVNTNTYWFLARDCKRTSEQRLEAWGEKIDVVPVSVDEFLAKTTKMWRNVISDLAEIKHDKGKRAAFKKKIFGSD